MEHILIVEPDQKQLGETVNLVTSCGRASLIASDYEGALKLCRTESISLLIVSLSPIVGKTAAFIEEAKLLDIPQVLLIVGEGTEIDKLPAVLQPGNQVYPHFKPLSKEGLEAYLPKKKPGVNTIRPKALIVDDEEDVRIFICEAFEMRGFDAFEAANGREALECLAREAIDYVITDVYMPKMNGLELIKKIREQDPTIPIVTISGAIDHSLTESLQLGASSTMEKPFDPDDLVNKFNPENLSAKN